MFSCIRRSLFVTFLCMCAIGASAQRPDRGGMGRPAIAKIYGRVLDATTRKAAEFASVSLLAAQKDSVINGALTQPNGDFLMERLPFGSYRLRISSLGYTAFEEVVNITPEHVEQDLGNLVLQPNQLLLKDAEVVAERSQTQLQVDRRVYNVEKDLAVRGGTGVDVMKNIPGLSVDADNNVQLRNNSPQIMIDGRPSALSLEQIPADEIERVEVITNPSVVFDASSSGGIINVVLKKSTRPGYNGQLQASAGTNGRVGANGNLNVKDGRWAWILSGNGNFADNTTNTRTSRDLFNEGSQVSAFRQDGLSGSDRRNYGGRLGVDLKVSVRSTLSVSGNVRGRGYLSDDALTYTERNGVGTLIGSGGQLNTGESMGNDASAQVGFKHKTPKEGREWNTYFTYNRSRRENRSTFLTSAMNGDGAAMLGGSRTQRSNGSTDGDQFTWQFDMSDPRNEKNKLEYGLRNNTRLEYSSLDVSVGTDTSEARSDPTLSNDYRITDIVNAAYVNWIRKLSEHWGMQAGLRAEQTWFEAELPGKSQRFSYRYPNGTDDLFKALFPAVYFSRKWEGTRELQFNASRKISRPNFFQVMPFIMFSDTRNIRIGNPALAPEFISLAEVNHLLPFKKNPRSNWLSSLFVRQTDDVITGFSSPLPEDSSILVNTWVNGDNSWTYGWENTIKFELTKTAQLTVGGTVQYVEIGAGALRNNGWVVNGKLNLNVKLPKDWSFQINGEYEGKRPQPQGYAIPNGGIDLSIGKDFGKHWGTQVLVNDVFFTRLWGTVLDTPRLYQETERRREMRFVRLQITWKFGEQDTSLFRRKSQRKDPGATGGEEGF